MQILRISCRENLKVFLFFFLIICIGNIQAQNNYEIQVYASQTQPVGSTMFELHSNYTLNGITSSKNGVFPANHSLHETLEITTGITSIFETGFYLFTNYTPGHGYQIVGTHIRPRIMAPADWGIPFGLSLSLEAGYQKPAYSDDTWSLEIRPIIDKQWGKFYASFNPTLGISLKSHYNNSVPTFEPNLKLFYNILENAALGIEYYGDMGSLNRFDPGSQQNQALFLAYDLQNNDKWELNIGAGFGLTPATDPFIIKCIIGRKVKWK
jgi:hypothetical protein